MTVNTVNITSTYRADYKWGGYLELSKFNSNSDYELSDIVSKVKTSLDMWITFLSHHDLLNKENLPSELNDKSLKKALNVLEVMSFTQDERIAYDDHLKYLRMEASAVSKATKDAREEGRGEGIEIGEARGREEEKLKIARDMLKNNIDINLISQITGISIHQLKDLT